MKKDQTRQILLKAGKGIIQSHGHDAVTVRRVAEVTGYSYPILYHHFKDLDAFLWTLRLEMIEEMTAELSQALNRHPESVEDVQRLFKQYAAYFFAHPNVFRFFYFHPFKKPDDDSGYSQLELRFGKMWQATFARLVENGDIRPDDIETIAKNIIFSLHGMIMLSLSANGSLTQAEVDQEIDSTISYLFRSSK